MRKRLFEEISEMIWKAELDQLDSVPVPISAAKEIRDNLESGGLNPSGLNPFGMEELQDLRVENRDLAKRIKQLEAIAGNKIEPSACRYDREREWEKFSDQIRKHIVQYTLIQYGNPEGNEQVDSFSIEDCFRNMERYFNRRNANVRGDKERLRDLIKIAHYAQLAYDKLRKSLNADDVYEAVVQEVTGDCQAPIQRLMA